MVSFNFPAVGSWSWSHASNMCYPAIQESNQIRPCSWWLNQPKNPQDSGDTSTKIVETTHLEIYMTVNNKWFTVKKIFSRSSCNCAVNFCKRLRKESFVRFFFPVTPQRKPSGSFLFLIKCLLVVWEHPKHPVSLSLDAHLFRIILGVPFGEAVNVPYVLHLK